MEKKSFLVSGMHCHSCAHLVEMALEELAGVKTAKVDFVASRAIVEFDVSKLNGQKIIEAIEKQGFSAKPL